VTRTVFRGLAFTKSTSAGATSQVPTGEGRLAAVFQRAASPRVCVCVCVNGRTKRQIGSACIRRSQTSPRLIHQRSAVRGYADVELYKARFLYYIKWLRTRGYSHCPPGVATVAVDASVPSGHVLVTSSGCTSFLIYTVRYVTPTAYSGYSYTVGLASGLQETRGEDCANVALSTPGYRRHLTLG